MEMIVQSNASAFELRLQSALMPFVGAKLNPPRDDQGCALDRDIWVDLFCPGVVFVDADIRAMDASGVTICRLGGFGEFIAWSSIQSIRVRRELGADMVLERPSREWRAAA